VKIRAHRPHVAAALALLLGCSGGGSDGVGSTVGDADPVDQGTALDSAVDDAKGFEPDATLPANDATPPTAAKVYANTDKELYAMDPLTKSVTKIGAFTNPDGSGFVGTMTDVAVDAAGKLVGCTVNRIFDLELPASGVGAVKATQRVAITGGSLFYALAYAPKGVLSAGEELIGGDSAGDLSWIPASGAPQKVGNFGTVAAGDPGGVPAGYVWQLSGDIAFFLNDGAPIGLATVRPCEKASDTTTCRNTNDVLIEIDVAALATKSATANLRKRYVGTSGTGYGRLFGVGAWDDKVYAFQRYAGASALLVAVSLADGRATIVKDFPEVAAARNGWSGAGVTTSAKIFIPK